MHYYSTNSTSPRVDFKEATIKGQAPDKGLYFPERIPLLPKEFINNIHQYSREEICYHVILPYVGSTIPPGELRTIVEETISFEFPLEKLSDTIYSLELFHGPTLAFKDVGARFMSRCLRHFVMENDKKITVLVATSGDTGGAVADGFFNVDGVEVVILYPSGKVSDIQERQLTTFGNNIRAIEVEGNFDDCQRLVKAAFADTEINKQRLLTSANSINVARWLPQQFYYFLAYQQWKEKEHPPVISVPSGNFGNICAGLLSYCSGLPAAHFIAACNANDSVPEFLKSGMYQPKETVHTISNAMDVGDPSNFIRILHLFNHHLESLKSTLTAYSISDSDTEQTIKEVHQNFRYVLDPHGAVAFHGLSKYLVNHPKQKGYFLETAHPVKFYNAVQTIIDSEIELPQSIHHLQSKQKTSTKIKATEKELKDYLLS